MPGLRSIFAATALAGVAVSSVLRLPDDAANMHLPLVRHAIMKTYGAGGSMAMPVPDAIAIATKMETHTAKHLIEAMLVDEARRRGADKLRLRDSHTGEAPTCGQCVETMTLIHRLADGDMSVNRTKAGLEECAIIKAKWGVDMCAFSGSIIVDITSLLMTATKDLAWDVPLTFCSNVFQLCKQPCCKQSTVPEQVRIGFAGSGADASATNTTMRVSWVTLHATPDASVQFRMAGSKSPLTSATAESRSYSNGGWVGRVHGAVMAGLVAGSTYEYRVGSHATGWSKMFKLRTLPTNAGSVERPLRVVQYGDQGYGPNSRETRAILTKMAAEGNIDFILHNGDISYADGDEQHWDVYFREMEPITSTVPYMMTPGNHEFYWNFAAYKARSWMPAPGDGAPDTGMYYRFDAGPFSFLMVDSESPMDTPMITKAQVAWVDRQLTRADSARKAAVLSLHRPMYCSNPDSDCRSMADLVRLALEETVSKHPSCRVVFSAHLHSYERTYPIMPGGWWFNTSTVDPKYVMHVISGAGGNREGITKFAKVPGKWSAIRVGEWGFQMLEMSGDASGKRTIKSDFIVSRDNTVGDTYSLEQHL